MRYDDRDFYRYVCIRIYPQNTSEVIEIFGNKKSVTTSITWVRVASTAADGSTTIRFTQWRLEDVVAQMGGT
jgi:hypothetical protein